jgi:ankyrin repeat protein
LVLVGCGASVTAGTASSKDFADPRAGEMVHAVARDQVARALELSRHAPDGVNAVGRNGGIPHLVAVIRDDAETINALLEAGAHPNGGPDRAPLHEAMRSRTLRTARLLLAAGADPSGRSGEEPALFESAILGDTPA